MRDSLWADTSENLFTSPEQRKFLLFLYCPQTLFRVRPSAATRSTAGRSTAARSTVARSTVTLSAIALSAIVAFRSIGRSFVCGRLLVGVPFVLAPPIGV